MKKTYLKASKHEDDVVVRLQYVRYSLHSQCSDIPRFYIAVERKRTRHGLHAMSIRWPVLFSSREAKTNDCKTV